METDNFSYLNDTNFNDLQGNDEKLTEISKHISKDIKAKNVSILQIIEKLGFLLANQLHSKREMGILILRETLQNIEVDSLSPEQLTILCAYFSQKLKDHHQVATASLRGVSALVNFSAVPSESIIQLITSIFQHITCQQQQQPDRYIIYQIFETVLNKYPYEINLLAADFVYGIISSIDGERDPKNLLYLFDWTQVFLKNVNLGHLTEEMFEVLSCYFPVDFRAPTGDNKITRDDLATKLCFCLTAIPEFGDYSIPLALEKLDSALKIAKGDSLDILKNGCKNFDVSTYFQYFVEICSQIQKEVFNCSDEELRRNCLETLTEVISKLSQGGEEKKFEKSINDITDTLKGNLMPDSKMFSHSSQILVAVAQASKMSSTLIARRACPSLENTFTITENSSQKALILKTYIYFAKCVLINSKPTDLNSVEEISSAPVLCSQAILDQDENLRIQGFEGFIELLEFIPQNIRKLFFTNLHTLLVIPQSSSLKIAVFKCIGKAAEVFPEEVEELVLHKENISNGLALDMYLEGLSTLIKVPYFQNYVVDILMSYVFNCLECSCVGIKHLIRVLDQFEKVADVLIEKNFVVKIVDFLNGFEEQVLNSEFLLNIILILQTILRTQNKTVQKNLYLSLVKGKNQQIYVAELSGFIVPMNRHIFEDFEKVNFLVECSLKCEDTFIKNVSVEVLANILNKMDNETVLEEILNNIIESCFVCNDYKRKVKVISWVAKSLVTRNHGQAWCWIDKMIDMLNENTEAAKGFRIIMDEGLTVLSKKYHCQVMPLYKQKFFIYATNKINEKCQTENDAYFLAIVYLIEFAPEQAVIGQFKKILRLLLLCLERCSEPEVLELILNRLIEFTRNEGSIIEDNLEDILIRVLNLTTFKQSMKVRIFAIKCIQQFVKSYQIYKLLPFKLKVIQVLGLCVDDKKRLVRKEAMDTRSMWFLLDSPL